VAQKWVADRLQTMIFHPKLSVQRAGVKHLRVISGCGEEKASLRRTIQEASVIVCSSLVEIKIRALVPKGKEIIVDNKRIDKAGVEMLRTNLIEIASGDHGREGYRKSKLTSSSCEGRRTMLELFASQGNVFIGFLCFLGSFALLLILRTHQRREAMLSTTVLLELNAPELRGLFTVKIRSKPFLGEVVAVDLWNCSRDKICEVMQRLAAQVPSRVRVEINGVRDCRAGSAWTLTARRKPSGLVRCFR
jgi:hypothetical protein